MNRHSNIRANSRSSISRLVCLGVLCTLGTALAPTPARATAQPTEAEHAGLWLSVDFQGGNAIEYVEAIRRVAENVNIVVMPGAELIEIPAMRLKAVALGSALEILDQQKIIIGETQYIVNVDEVEADSIPLTAEEKQREGLTTNYTLPIYVVNIIANPVSRGFRQPSTTSAQVWAVESLIGILSADHLLAAVDVALPLATAEEPDIEIRFHEETGILIARGEIAALQMIDQVIAQLEQTAYTRLAIAAEDEAQHFAQLELEWEQQFSLLLQEQDASEEIRSEMQYEMAALQATVENLVTELEERNYQIQQLETEITLLQTEMAREKYPE